MFIPPQADWHHVSERLAVGRRAVALSMLGATALVAETVLAATGAASLPAHAALIGALVLLAAWSWWLIGRQVRAYRYAERADDLLVASGVLVRRLVIVPYGRMQLVDVVAGPLDRALGIATLQLHTASASSDATIPGLPPGEAAELRDRLAALGEERTAGL